MNSMFSKLSMGLLLGAYLFTPFIQTAKADDTEVYFLDGSLINTGRPQVMLLMEFSSAMNGGGRLSKIQEALKQLATDPDVNSKVDFGLSFFSKRKGNPAQQANIVYPIADFNSSTTSPTFSEVVDDLSRGSTISGSTPTIEGMSEAYRYFNADSAHYWNNSATWVTHPDAYSGSTYTFSSSASACASKALVVLAHGQVNGSEWPNATADIVGSQSSSYCTGGRCTGSDMISYMKDVNGVSTYTISPGSSGNNLNNLNNWANAGGTEEAFEWDDSVDCNAVDPVTGEPVGLCAILKTVIEEVASQGTSFVQAGVTVSQQNRLNHDNHLYFAQFQADGIARWPGNLKKYKIDSGKLVDQVGDSAVDPDTGLFAEKRDTSEQILSSESFWSASPDGNQVELGGAVEQFNSFLETTEYTAIDGNIYQKLKAWNRNLYTDRNGTRMKVVDANEADFGYDTTSGTYSADEYKNIKNLTLGYSLSNEVVSDSAGTATETVTDVVKVERLMGDPLHSVPKVLQYSNGKSLAFMGTNLGYLHAIDISNGKEEWAYVPSEMLTKMSEFMQDIDIGGKPELHNYGLDGEIYIAHADTDGDLEVDLGDDPDTTDRVETAEKAYLIIGMRRGGGSYYVIDVSSNSAPVLKSKLDSNITGLGKLDQTWSTPIVTNIPNGKADSGVQTALIFGAGYDEDIDEVHDTTSPYNGTVDVGNDVIIYSLSSNKVLWSLQTSSLTTAKGQLHSVPSAIRSVSIGNNGVTNHLYVSDTAGQVFRLDLKSDENATNGFSVSGGRIFTVNNSSQAETKKGRFFYAPSVAYIPRPNGHSFVAVAIGSGYRAHPLDTVIQDHFFMVRDTGVLSSDEMVNQ